MNRNPPSTSPPEILTLACLWLPAAGAAVLPTDPPTQFIAATAALLGSAALLLGVRRERTGYHHALSLEINRLKLLADSSSARASFSQQLATTEIRPIGDVEIELLGACDAVDSRLKELRLESVELREVFDTVEIPVLATNALGVVTLANLAANQFFDTRQEPIEGAAIEDLFSQALVLSLHAAAAGGVGGQAQIRVPRGSTFCVYQVQATPFGQNDETRARRSVVLTLRDVTDLATAVQLKTDFVANASHELRTPLSSIRAAVDTLESGARDDPPMVDRLIEMIRKNANRLEEIVMDLLDLSRLETDEAPMQTEPVDLGRVFESLREMFAQVSQERSLELLFECEPSLRVIHTDSRSIHLILKNLVDNSTKYAYEGTTVILRVEPLPDSTDDRGVRLNVIDQGVGIPIGQQNRVFERFFQVDPSRTGLAKRRGTGLGLAIVKHAVKSLGGTISVDSVWRQGTTMIVDLPRVYLANQLSPSGGDQDTSS